MDDDATVRVVPPHAPKPIPGRPRWPILAVAVFVTALLAGGGGAWFATRYRTPAPTPVVAVVPPRIPVAPPVRPAPPVPPLPVATEAEIDADQPAHLTLFRFQSNPNIVVFDFPTLREQGLMFNRIAAFAEKVGEPHDRVLTDPQLDRAIAAHGDTVETYYYGHDYGAETLRRFFALADRDHVVLYPEEERLRRIATEQGMLAADSNQAVITVPRLGADESVDATFRRTILHHELSHGEYFTDPAYVAYAYHFFNDVMDATERADFERFLASQDYDPKLHDLIVNETQAYLMHTPDPRVFNAKMLGMSNTELSLLRAKFLLGMPPGWLRDCTSVPGVTVANPGQPAEPVRDTQPARGPSPVQAPRQRGAVSTGTAATATRSPRRCIAARLARRSRR
jgi:hypothetical protein